MQTPTSTPSAEVGAPFSLDGAFFKQNNWTTFFDKATCGNSELRVGDCVVRHLAAAAYESETEEAPGGASATSSPAASNTAAPGSATKIIRAFVSEGDLPVYVLVEDIYSRSELLALGVRCDSPTFDQFFPSNNITAITLRRLVATYSKCPSPLVSRAYYVDADRKEVLLGTILSADRIRTCQLSNHNISFYHAVHKRCTAHVVGEILPDDGIDGALLLVRYFYRYDEDDVVVADAAKKQVEAALKGRTYFKKVPRLWSNHFAIARVKNPRLEDAILFCDPADFTHLEVCCFYRFQLPQKRIMPLPAYLKELPATVPQLELPPVEEIIITRGKPRANHSASSSEGDLDQVDRRRRKRPHHEDSKHDRDPVASLGFLKKPKLRASASDEASDEASASTTAADYSNHGSPRQAYSSPLNSHRGSLDMGQPSLATAQMMRMVPPAAFYSAYYGAPYMTYPMYAPVGMDPNSQMWSASMAPIRAGPGMPMQMPMQMQMQMPPGAPQMPMAAPMPQAMPMPMAMPQNPPARSNFQNLLDMLILEAPNAVNAAK